MDELLFILVVFGILLAIVTLVGHGIWIALAWLFGGAKSKALHAPGRTATACPRCGSALAFEVNQCSVCEWPGPLPAGPRRRAALVQLQAQLARFETLGTIDKKACDQLVAAIKTQLAEPATRPESVAPPAVDSRDDAVMAEIVAPDAAPKPPSADKPSDAISAPPPTEMPAADVEERARRYADARQAAAVAAADEPEPPPAVRREALLRVLSAFMEERNIRWGELVGGMLIVCCSIALVISFWSQIAQRPLLKFVIFNGVSAGLFGAGFYTLRRWQIHTTSQGLLIIATLLVPLNFLAIAAFTKDAPPTDVLSIGGELLSLAVFAALCYLAARTILPSAPMLLTSGVILTSAVQLLTRRFAGGDVLVSTQYALAVLPIGCYVAVTGLYFRRGLHDGAQADEYGGLAAGRVFILLGISTYAASLPLGLLAYQSGAVLETLSRLAPLVSVFAVPALVTGLLFWRRRLTATKGAEETIGIAIGVAGAVLMVVALVLAWPDPALLLPTAATMAVLFALLAFKFEIPEAHLVSAASVLATWIVTFCVFWNDLPWILPSEAPLLQAMLTATCGNALVPLVALFSAAALGLGHLGHQSDARWYLMASAATVVLSLGLIVGFGFAREGDSSGVTWSLGIYAVAALAALWKTHRVEIAWAATTLLLASLVQGVVFRYADALQLAHPWIVALLVHATLVAVGTALTCWRRTLMDGALAMYWSSLATSVAAVVLLIGELTDIRGYAMAGYLGWIAGVWFVVSLATGWRTIFSAFQLTLGLAVSSAVVGALESRDWYLAADYPWLDPWFVEAQGVVLAVYCSAWTILRISLARFTAPTVGGTDSPLARFRAILRDDVVAIDRLLQVLVVTLLTFVAVYSVAPSVAQELALTPKGQRDVPPLGVFAIPNAAHEHTAGWGGWLMLATTTAMVAIGLWRDLIATRAVALLIIGALGCLLVAACWESDVAGASALRWAVGGYAIAASIPIWGRRWLRSVAVRAGIQVDQLSRNAWALDRVARTTIIGVVVLAYMAMGAYVSTSAVERAGVPDNIPSVLRVLSIVCLVAVVVALAVATSAPHGESSEVSNTTPSRRANLAWQTLLMMGISPLVAGCIYVVADALRQFPIVGPMPGTWFATIGTSALYGVPLAALIVALLGHASRERSPGYALCAALFVNLLTTIVFLIELARAGRPLDRSAWIELAQVNAIAVALFSLAWLAAMTRWGRRQSGGAASTSALLASYIAFGVALYGVTVAWGVGYLSIFPDAPGSITAAGALLGWIALALSTMALFWLSWRTGIHYAWAVLAGSSGVLVSMVALAIAHWDQGDWLAYHTLLAGFAAAAWFVPILARATGKRGAADARLATSVILATLFTLFTVALSLRGLWGDPQTPWWTVVGLLAMSALAAVLACEAMNRWFVWASAGLLNLAVSIWYVESGHQVLSSGGGDWLRDGTCVNIIAAAVTAIYSVVIERRLVARQSPSKGISWHNVAVWGIAAVLIVVVGGGLLADVGGIPEAGNVLLAAVALAATAAVAVARLWDSASRGTVACFYTVGAIGPAMLLDTLDIVDHSMFVWAATMFAAAYALASSYLWSRRPELTAAAARYGVPLAIETRVEELTLDTPTYAGHVWLLIANGMIAALVLVSVVWIEWSYDIWKQRNTAAYSLVAVALAIGFLSRGKLRTPLQYVSLAYGVLFAVAWGWSWLPPDVQAPLLHRAIVAVVALAVMTPLYGFGLVKFWWQENEWTRAGQRLLPTLVAVGGVLLMLVVGGEVSLYVTNGVVPVQWPARLAVAVALVGLMVAALAAAVVPGRDPLKLSERGRAAYVYAAEIIAALLFAHIRITMPWLFTGWFQQVWPLIVMGVAFLGVGFSEFCQRRRQVVLFSSLNNTAALMPILPVMGFWFVSNNVNYSLLLLTVGALYATLAVLRRSYLFSMLAVLAANASLWRLLYTLEGLGLAEHPQLWLIPPAICVLVASYLNRRRLDEQQMTTIRYLSAIVIYASSTAEIFLNGVATAPWLPGVLAVLAILGIFAGILLRVRAFLFLGITFLMVALMTIIWYAAVELDHTWIWWVSGIVVGVLIIALFGLFEKKRDEMLLLVENLKQWES